ncbi:type 2 phosphatidylinositol 4,5-bisphosphate 4-phosphatase-like [Sycon ciliatum]|uniref:type 2 phosphatidylinositol 4,5-bisphosphate 4-phosphatase-like n=1 Tax=Sycon ciliatum TaxID=27933 RepID=UPI0020A9A35B|eukprot:scpid70010/ scgid30606/ Transmembrane protein 55A; PtdIns-4,5-P2 4-Ptase II; Type II phosphatidylinositol 4,5-bisphosphate 4-phosphatase
MMADPERAPLLSAEDGPAIAMQAAPPAYSDVVEDKGTAADSQHRRRVVCEVCRTSLTYSDRPGLRVVRCSRCQEATPVGPPPPGKRYVRCACHCLLTCLATSKLVACPRQNCKRTVRLTPTSGTVTVVATTQRVTCPRCQITVPWNTRRFGISRCYACNSLIPINSAMHTWAMRRARMYTIIGAVLLLLAITITVVTVELSVNGGVFVVPVGFYGSGTYFLVRGLMYFCAVHGAPVE